MNSDMYVDQCLPATQVDLYCNTLILFVFSPQKLMANAYKYKLNKNGQGIHPCFIP